MTANEFCCRMYNDICTVLNRSYQVWCCKRIVNNQRDFMCMSDLCDSFNIYYVWIRVAQSFDINSFCIILDSCFYCIQIKDIYKGCCDTVLWQCVLQQVEGTAVNIFCRYDVVTVLCQVFNGIWNSCCSGCYCQCCNTAFQSCDSLFEYILCRVCQSSVDVTGICQTKSCSCMIAVTEYIRRSLINRNCPCIGDRVWSFLTYVKL